MFACFYAPKLDAELSLANFAYSFSPLVEETKPNTVVIDIDGCELLFGSAYQLANDVFERSRQTRSAGGLETKINVALAANPDAAIHAATNLNGITFVVPGEELTCLGEFRLQVLDPSLVEIEPKRTGEILETLRMWGVHTFGEFARLPLTGIAERLGPEGLKLQKLAGGKTDRQLKLRQSPPVFDGSIELDYAVAELEPLSFIFARLLNQICASLNSYALATNELQVRMLLENQSTHERVLTLPFPMRDHKVFLKLLLLDIEMHPPLAAVKAVSINCEPVKPRVLQNGLFIPLAPAPDKLELTLARLAKLVGEDKIGSPSVLDTHRPDSFSIKRFELKTHAQKRSGKKSSNRQLPIGIRQCFGFRMFRPPLRAVVEVDSGIPRQVSAWGKQRSIYGKVIKLSGPWRTTGDWWRNDRWARDEWDVAIESSKERLGIYRIYRELISGNWFIEGNYD
jgi:protein ImuB